MFKNKIIYIYIFLGLLSCQPVEILERPELDLDNLPKIIINADEKNINNLFESKINDSFIDHALSKPPKYFLENWLVNNIDIFGTENRFEINIIDASLKKIDIKNTDTKKYQDKIINFLEINLIVEFVLYDDSNIILARSIVESNRSTTSRKHISLNQLESILDQLIIDCLFDFSSKTEDLIKLHMKNFII